MRLPRTFLFCLLALGLVFAGPLAHVLPGEALAAALPAEAASVTSPVNSSDRAAPGKRCQRGAIIWSACGDPAFLPAARMLAPPEAAIATSRSFIETGDELREGRVFRPPRSI